MSDLALHRAVEARMENIALLHERGRELVSPCFRWIRDLAKFGVPDEYIAVGFEFLRRCCDYNGQLIENELIANRVADEHARRGYTNNRANALGRALGVKAAARALREPLRVLREPDSHSSQDFVDAYVAIRHVIRECGRNMLESGSLRHELGRGPHDLLLSLVPPSAPAGLAPPSAGGGAPPLPEAA